MIGALFRSDRNTRVKTNLLVFLRPYILRDKGQDQEITANRMQFMDAKQGEFKPSTMLLPPVKDMPKLEEVLPPIMKPATPASPAQNSAK